MKQCQLLFASPDFVLPRDVTEVNITDLEPYTEYRVTMCAVASIGPGEYTISTHRTVESSKLCYVWFLGGLGQ